MVSLFKSLFNCELQKTEKVTVNGHRFMSCFLEGLCLDLFAFWVSTVLA